MFVVRDSYVRGSVSGVNRLCQGLK
jgi:hypothetical protein